MIKAFLKWTLKFTLKCFTNIHSSFILFVSIIYLFILHFFQCPQWNLWDLWPSLFLLVGSTSIFQVPVFNLEIYGSTLFHHLFKLNICFSYKKRLVKSKEMHELLGSSLWLICKPDIYLVLVSIKNTRNCKEKYSIHFIMSSQPPTVISPNKMSFGLFVYSPNIFFSFRQ